MKGHINIYSCYSFQNSSILIDDLCKQASKLGLESLALTDTNNMYGALEFYLKAKKYNLKPIFGVEASVSIEGEIYPFTILAKDLIGYKDLIRIVSRINLNEPKCISMDALSIYKEHLFIIAGKESIIHRLIKKNMVDQAVVYINKFKEVFKEYFYVAVFNYQDESEKLTTKTIQSLSQLHNFKVCGSNEVRYLERKDALTVELLKASKEGMVLDNLNVLNDEKYLKSGYEMDMMFSKDIINNTDFILDMCNVELDHEKHLPKYPLEKGTAKEYLFELCKVGLKKRFNNQTIPQDYKDRLIKELKVINKMGFNDYFLIVFDYVRFAKRNNILVGPGRGSAAGSLVSYVLGITNVDPIKYDLLFERFLNEERISMPDIDIDFQDDRRDEVVEYVTKKYGQDHVAQIVTFSTYGPRTAIRDLGKVIGLPLPKLDMIAKLVPTGPKDKKSVQQMYNESNRFQQLVTSARYLDKILPAIDLVEKLPRNISMHAAGVILSGDNLFDVVPLTKGPSNSVVTQYSKNYIEEVGLLKMDFLGLKNLTIISNIVKDVKDNQGIDININNISLDDKKTYKLLREGNTLGVFQLESTGMTNTIIKMKCDCLNDIIAALALYRPGPMKFIGNYLDRKFKKEKVTYPLECLKDILEPTYGIIIYQEQIMQVATRVAGFSLSKADILRKGMSKKSISTLSNMKAEFIEGSINNGFTKEEGEKVFDLIERFANYGFNKSHSVAYGIIAYQLAYLKAHYPLEFYCALLTNDQSSERNKLLCKQEMLKQGIKLLPPSVNKSKDRFTSEDGNIRFSLLAIKGFGGAAYSVVETKRQDGPFKSVADFLYRLDGKLTSTNIDALIYSGSFDEFDKNRLNIIHNYPRILQYVEMKADNDDTSEPIYENVGEDKNLRLQKEREVLGVYLSNHPLTTIKAKYKTCTDINRLSEFVDKKVNVVMQLTRVQYYTDKKGQEMAFIEGNDDTGSLSGVVFASQFSMYKSIIQRGFVLLVNGKITFKNGLSITVDKMEKIK
ncbi:MAG: DNA polymerase III subunit alpha [Thomasclavelia sp.]|nr:DNA polymerase III subunit alpha [Thomasclavelia sp.]